MRRHVHVIFAAKFHWFHPQLFSWFHIIFSQLWAWNITKTGTRFRPRRGSRWWHIPGNMFWHLGCFSPACSGPLWSQSCFFLRVYHLTFESKNTPTHSFSSVSALTHGFRMRTLTHSRLIDKNAFFFLFIFNISANVWLHSCWNHFNSCFHF